jgi:hypothetical protein
MFVMSALIKTSNFFIKIRHNSLQPLSLLLSDPLHHDQMTPLVSQCQHFILRCVHSRPSLTPGGELNNDNNTHTHKKATINPDLVFGVEFGNEGTTMWT